MLSILGLFLVFGTLLRFISLNQSFWLDEAITANVVRNLSFSQILSQFSPHDFHPPGYYFLLKLWSNYFGYSEVSLRFPSILFSLVSAIFVFIITRQLFNRRVAFLSTLFFYFNPLIIYYSQEARSYSLVVLLFLICFYFFRQQNWFLLNLFIFFSLAVFYGSLFFILPFFVYFLFQKKISQAIYLLPGLVVFVVLLGPLLYGQLLNSRNLLVQVPHWSNVLGQLDLKNLFLIPIKFLIGRISFYPKILYWALSSIWVIFNMWFVFKASLKNVSLVFFLLSPLILTALFALVSQGGFLYFRLLYLIPLVTILLAAGIYEYKILSYAALLFFIVLSCIYLFVPQYHRENWKAILSQVPQDANLWMIKSFADPVIYYRPDIKINDLKLLPVASNNRFFVLPYGEVIHGIDHLQMMKGLNKVASYQENQITLEEWRY